MTDPDPRPAAGPAPRVGAGRIDDQADFPQERGEATPAPQESFWDGLDDPRRDGKPQQRRRRFDASLRSLIEWAAVGVGALAVALLIKAFLLQAFYIPSESMVSTLNIDDRVLVNKLSYRIGEVDRGDIVVFEKPPAAPGTIKDFIKRVVALPGETITFADGDIFIDGRLLTEPYVNGNTVPSLAPITGPGCVNTPAPDRCTLADDYYFVLGDNRGNSTDSRSFGPIPEETIVGRAFLKVWPLSDLGFL